MTGIKEMTSSDYSQVKIVLKRCSTVKDKAVSELRSQNSHRPNYHTCPICGSVELDGSQMYKMSPVQIDLYHKLMLLEACGDDNLTMNHAKDPQFGWSCQKCITKFELLELLRKEISVLEDKMEKILRQLRKTISYRRAIISQPAHLPLTKPDTIIQTTFLDVDQEEVFESVEKLTPTTDEENVVDKKVDFQPVLMDFQDEIEIKDELQQLQNDDDEDDDDDDVANDEPLSKANSISDERLVSNLEKNANKSRICKIQAKQVISAIFYSEGFDDDMEKEGCSLSNEGDTDSDNTDELESDSVVNKSRICKTQAKQVISAIYCNEGFVDDMEKEDEYFPSSEGDTDSDNTIDLGSDSDTGSAHSEHKPAKRMPPIPSTRIDKLNFTNICPVCGKQVVHIDMHMQTHSPDGKKFSCETCFKTFSTIGVRNAHTRSIHLKMSLYKCEKCEKGFYNHKDFKRHINMRIPCTEPPMIKKFTCSICQGGFSTKANLQQHIRQRHNGEKLINCPHSKCKGRFYKDIFLQRHLKLQHPQEEETERICEICNETFPTILQKFAHIRSSHTCQFCNTLFPNKTTLDEHEATHTEDKPYLCTKCGHRFAAGNALNLHLQNICNSDKNEIERMRKLRNKRRKAWLSKRKDAHLKCDFCLNTYIRKERLALHISKCHQDKFMFVDNKWVRYDQVATIDR